jgi:intergrase/recombinase|tara:strand:- start:282 stop:458 length:177 start_codon:yes stop_codon:yes gene_type:complete
MIIEINTTDDDGIKLETSFNSNFEYEEDYADFIKLVFKVLIKSGVDVPEEIVEMLDNV